MAAAAVDLDDGATAAQPRTWIPLNPSGAPGRSGGWWLPPRLRPWRTARAAGGDRRPPAQRRLPG
jgi:hypothetical protein